jgi:hypothetical protein
VDSKMVEERERILMLFGRSLRVVWRNMGLARVRQSRIL